ncbi:putative zinc finger protein [Trypanosoma grayi]|uniref:putative zinc finger protein n=1 Tax=Trypanosoma grayi TaxID=71804 RepID=UPI0004F404BE|nr:putative zinc finger protein [Trypanosoma grayi]KEG08517.1 putative zinc finger protein [Trypanosoma grayi]
MDGATGEYSFANSTALMEEIQRSATAFLWEMCGNTEKGLLESLQGRIQGLFSSRASNAEADLDEVLQRVYRRRLQEEEGANERTSTAGEADGVTYWVGRRPLPVVTEEEVNEAMGQLTEAELKRLEEEFAESQDDGYVLLGRNSFASDGEKDGAPADKDNGVHNNDNNNNEDAAGDAYLEVVEPRDTKSMFFGGHTVELMFDEAAWPMSARGAEGTPLADDLAGDAMPRRFVFSSAPSTVKSRPPEQRCAEYVRNQVHMMLLANRVAKDTERRVADAALRASAEIKQERDKELSAILEQLVGAVREAVRLTRLMQSLDRQAIGEYAQDPYRTQNWLRNEAARSCHKCGRTFTIFVRQHHCRRCGLIFCQRCSSHAGILPDRRAQLHSSQNWVRLCEDCYVVCCRHQRGVSAAPVVPRSSYERDGRAPMDLSLLVLADCPNPGATLEDNLPPFYVVLPEDWYALRPTTASGWANAASNVPFHLLEGVQDGACRLSRVVVPHLYGWMTGAINSVQRIREKK